MDRNKLRLLTLKSIGILDLIKVSLGFIIMLYFIINLSFLNVGLTILYLFLETTFIIELIFLYGFFKYKEWGRQGFIYMLFLNIIVTSIVIFLNFSIWKDKMTNREFFRTIEWIPISGWMIYYLTRDSIKSIFHK